MGVCVSIVSVHLMVTRSKEDGEVENSAHAQQTGKRRMTKPWVVVPTMLAVVSLMALAASTACAGTSAPIAPRAPIAPIVRVVSEMVWPEGIPGDVPGVRGDFELRLNIGERGDVRFRARGRAEGPGIINHALYSMWLNNPAGEVVFIDAAQAREEPTGKKLLTGEVDCMVGVDLRDDLVQAPFNATSIEDLTATIREGPGSNRLMAQAPLKVSDLEGRVVLQFTFTEFELASLVVPVFGERQRRFVPQGELSDDRRCIDGRFFDDRRDRDRRDREDQQRRDREDQQRRDQEDQQRRDREDQEDQQRRDREDQQRRDRQDQEPRDREDRVDRERQERDDRGDQERRDRQDQEPQDRQDQERRDREDRGERERQQREGQERPDRQDQERGDRERRDREDQERRRDDEEQRQDEESGGG